jgi:hypothetical protein
MNNKATKYLAVIFLMNIVTPLISHADEADDLINKILQSSPTENAKAKSYKSHAVASKKSTTAPSNSLGIPESQLLEASAKFTGDVNGKYIYGPVTLKSIKNDMGEPAIHLTAKNMRSFLLYTRDPAVLEAFSSGWGAQYNIPKNFPLRIVGKPFPGFYAVRMPYDQDTTNHGFGELLNNAAR